MNLTQYEHKHPQEIQYQARELANKAKQSLVDAHQLLQLCSKKQTDRYMLGKLREEIWAIEQSFGNHRVYLSAAGQDRYIRETFFKDKNDGVFVEIGGYNGWRGSNAYFFEKTCNWTGVIVEASPTQVKEIPKYRNAEIVHAAISDVNGEAEFIDIVSGLTQMSGLISEYPDDMLAKVRNYPGNRENIVKVPTMRLDSLLDSYGMKHVDYCSIDVEGAERNILSTFDFNAYDVTVFSIENNSSDYSRSLAGILEPAGYRLAEVIGSDEIYCKMM